MGLKSLKSIGALLLLVVAVHGPALRASDFYEWTDEQGVKHYADSIEEVPEKYRDQVKDPPPRPPKPRSQPASEATAAPTPTVAIKPAAAPASAPALKRIEVPYENEGATSRIILPVTFNDRVTVPIALDTGSPGLVISLKLADRLGLLSSANGTLLVEAAGIGGSTVAIRTIVDSIAVQGARDQFVPTTVTGPLSPAFEGLVGMDFLSGYNVSIDSARRIVVFEERPPNPNAPGGHDEAWWRRTFGQFRSARDGWEAWKKQAGSNNRRIQTAVVEVVDFQIREADKLLMRLEGYASDHAVPRHWR